MNWIDALTRHGRNTLGQRRLKRLRAGVENFDWSVLHPSDEEVVQAILSVPTHFVFTELSITATLVVPGAGAVIVPKKVFGETVTAGQAIYATTDGLLHKAFANGTAAQAGVLGIALNGGAVNQYAQYQSGGQIVIGGTLTVAMEYFLSNNTPGSIGFHQSDLSSTNNAVRVGVAVSTTVLGMDINNNGVMP